jgi:single-strand DNA-binding protein
MAGVNKVILIGNLGAKPEMKYTQSGVPVTKMNIATTERGMGGKDESGKYKDHTEWHRVTAWRKLAEICNQYLDKGTKVYIEGRLRTNKWTTQDNVTKYFTEIVADNMLILSPKSQRESVTDAEPYDVPDEFPSSSGTSFPSGATSSHGTEDIDLDLDDLDENFL